MNPDASKKNGQAEPERGPASESGSTMKAAPNGPFFDPRRLSIEDLADPDRAEEALTHWEELEPKLLTAIEIHPQHGPRLSMLRRADRWLEAHGPELSSAGACPTSEELYDFGRGPGFGPLTSDRRREIDLHLRRCAECEAFVESLATPPPVPLDLPGAMTAPGPMFGGTAEIPSLQAARSRYRRLQRLAPLAAAATVIVSVAIWYAVDHARTTAAAFPGAPLLRGSSTSTLLFPRDRVLHASERLRAAFPALDGSLAFELDTVAGAEGYEVDVARHGGDAFATEETKLFGIAGSGPTLVADRTQASSLGAGEYTWTARAKVRGLDEPLGQRDFAIVDDAALTEELLHLADRADPEKSLAAVNLLHAKGFLTDARAIARSMPASPERDAYLARARGR
jgi:hypothetical protein